MPAHARAEPAHARAELDAGARPVSAGGGRAGGGQEGLRRTLGRRAKTSAEGRAPCRLETQAARLPPHPAVLEGRPRSGRERAGGAAETAQAREAAAQARAGGARAGSGPAGRPPRPLPQVRVARPALRRVVCGLQPLPARSLRWEPALPCTRRSSGPACHRRALSSQAASAADAIGRRPEAPPLTPSEGDRKRRRRVALCPVPEPRLRRLCASRPWFPFLTAKWASLTCF